MTLGPDATVRVIFHSQSHSHYRVVLIQHKYLKISVPHCAKCACKLRRRRGLFKAALLATTILGVVLAIHFDLGNWATVGIGIALSLPFLLMETSILGSPASGVEIGNYNDNCVIFHFRSTDYALQFKELNGGIEI